MILLKAFVLGGMFCLMTQLLFIATKKSILAVLTSAFCMGVILSATGVMNHFTGFGQAGMFFLLYGAGDAAYLGFMSLLSGDPVPIVRFSCLILFCCLIGISGGFILHNRQKYKIL